MKDLTGQRFGRLTVIAEGDRVLGRRAWVCKCDCGSEVTVVMRNLNKNGTKSCGCLRKDNALKTLTTHGMSGTKLYKVWDSMKWRCTNSKAERYMQYGGRGIKVCAEWGRFENFRDWAIRSGYRDGLSIERRNVDGDYSPDNCEWIPLERQCQNKTTSRTVLHGGKKVNIAELAKISNLPYSRVYQRIVRLGWSVEDAVR